MSATALETTNMPTLSMPTITNAVVIAAPMTAIGCLRLAGHGSATSATASTGTARIS